MIENITTENSNQTLEERKKEALQTAAKCRQILLENGACLEERSNRHRRDQLFRT